jgi:hypothetical protein
MARRIRDLLLRVHNEAHLCHRDVHVGNIVLTDDERPLLIGPKWSTPIVNDHCYDLEGPDASNVAVPEIHREQGHTGVWWESTVEYRGLEPVVGPPRPTERPIHHGTTPVRQAKPDDDHAARSGHSMTTNRAAVEAVTNVMIWSHVARQSTRRGRIAVHRHRKEEVHPVGCRVRTIKFLRARRRLGRGATPSSWQYTRTPSGTNAVV